MSDALEGILARAQLPLTPEELDRLQRHWPVVQEWLAELELPEARYAEPATIFSATRRQP